MAKKYMFEDLNGDLTLLISLKDIRAEFWFVSVKGFLNALDALGMNDRMVLVYDEPYFDYQTTYSVLLEYFGEMIQRNEKDLSNLFTLKAGEKPVLCI